MRLELVRGRFLRRYRRFFAEVEVEGGRVTAHCPNTGTMRTLLSEGAEAWVRHSSDPRRKLSWTLTLLGVPGGLALVDTALPNRVVEEAVREGRIPELEGYARLRREARIGERSRADLLLEDPGDPRRGGRSCFVEVKNCTMRSDADPARCDFPDAVTVRGRQHLEELSRVARSGGRAVQFFLQSRTDCRSLGIAAEIDPEYAAALDRAREAGVEVLAYHATITPACVEVGAPCPIAGE